MKLPSRQQVFYVGDEPMNMYDWANAFSLAITKKKVRVVPTFFVYTLAACRNGVEKFQNQISHHFISL